MNEPAHKPESAKVRLLESMVRPTRIECGILLAAKWLTEYGQPTIAADMLREHGVNRRDIRKLDEQDQKTLSKLNAEKDIALLCRTNAKHLK